MSVPVSQRGENRLEVFIKARELATYTATVCGNTETFPGRYKAITNRIMGAAWDCARKVWRANGTYVGRGCPDWAPDERLRLQSDAISDCDELLFEMQLMYEVFPKSRPTLAKWSELATDTKDLIKRWHEADRNRLSPRG